jgi:hypothetical protein
MKPRRPRRPSQKAVPMACVIYRPGHALYHRAGPDPYHGLGRGSPGRGRGPGGDHVQHGRDLLPSNPQRTVRRRGAAQPSERPRTVGESNSLHAICSAFLRDTNNPQPTRTQDLALEVKPEPPGAVVGAQL